LKEGFTFDGEFAVTANYPMGVAPNPCLELDGLGTVGLPLGERDAQAIVSASESIYGLDNEAGNWAMSADKVCILY
jgi:hypothetical protein